MKNKLVIVTFLAAFALAGCTSGQNVGNKDLLNVKKSPTATATASKKASPTKKPATKKPSRKPSPAATTTNAPTLRIKILGGSCGLGKCGFSPQQAGVAKGTKVIVENTDTSERSWATEDGSWDSGLIKPGKTFTFTANKVGTFRFTDKHTAPYTTGTLFVQ